MTWRPYPAYQPVDSKGLEEIPANWTAIKLRHVLAINPAVPVVVRNTNEEVSFLPMEAIGEDGTLDLSRTRPVQEVLTGYSYFADGDVVFAKVTPCFENGKAALIQKLPSVHGFGTTEVTTLRPGPRLDQGYLGYLVRSDRFRQSAIASMTGAGGLKRVPDEHVRDFYIALPPIAEQKSIAHFLGSETAKIDTLIANQEQLIATLREDRTATITHAVTKGLDPAVDFVQPHSPTLPACPNHWTAQISLKRLAEVQTGLTLGKSVNPAEAVEVPYLRVANVQTSGVNLDEVKTVAVHRSELSRYLLREGDVLMTEGGDIDKLGRGCVWSDEVSPCIHQNHVFAVRCKDTLSSAFLVYLLDTAVARNYFFMTAKKTTNLASTNSTTLGAFTFSLPPRPEQDEIVGHLNERCAGLDALIAKANAVIAVLREYRSALITDAVTGKIDVRGAVA